MFELFLGENLRFKPFVVVIIRYSCCFLGERRLYLKPNVCFCITLGSFRFGNVVINVMIPFVCLFSYLSFFLLCLCLYIVNVRIIMK